MNLVELKALRKKQLIMTNGLLLVIFGIYLILMYFFNITLSHMNLFIGALLFIQAVYTFMKRDSTKAIIPIFEQVAIYEKEKMGEEWVKQRKASSLSLFFLSGMVLVNAYLSRDVTDLVFTVHTLLPIMFLFLILVIAINLFLIMHMKKVDQSNRTADFKAYTLKTNIIGVIVGIVIAVTFFGGIVIYFMITL